MPQSGYQIIDEVSSEKSKRAPWNPRALFFLTWVMYILLSITAPLGLAFSAWNWARLGEPKQRLVWLPVSVLTFFLLIFIDYCIRQALIERDVGRIIAGVTIFGLAYMFLIQQRPIFERRVANGGTAANSLPLWIAGLGLCGALILWIIRK